MPNKGEPFDLEALDRQMVRYYGYYSNVSRGKRKLQDKDDTIPSILESDGSSKEYRRNWARLIKKIYEVDPLTCPKCQNQMKIISAIENQEVIKKILKHLGLWEVKPRPPPIATCLRATHRQAGPPKPPEYSIDYSYRGVGPYGPEADSQLPQSDNLSRASRSNEWLYEDPVYTEILPS